MICSVWWHQDRKGSRRRAVSAVPGVRHGMCRCGSRSLEFRRGIADKKAESSRLGLAGRQVQVCLAAATVLQWWVPSQPKVNPERNFNLPEYVHYCRVDVHASAQQGKDEHKVYRKT
jgi:hypothetical protein